MRWGSHHRALRWAGRVGAGLAAAVIVVTSARFVPAYLSDRSLSNQAGYLGTLLGAVSLLIVLAQFLNWLRRQERPETLSERLRSEIAEDTARRTGQMRRTAEDISLTYRATADDTEVNLTGLTRALLHERSRVVLLGHPGRGKSYSALQIALEAIRTDTEVVPLVVPLSRWAGGDDVEECLAQFVATEFNVSRSSARDVIRSGKVFPLFDGLDELCPDEASPGPAQRFLEELIGWRVQGAPAPFLLTCRRTVWSAIGDEARLHHTLNPYVIMPVRYAQATTYLSRSLGGTDVFSPAVDLAAALKEAGQVTPLGSPWQLSLIAELARNRLRAGGSGAALVTVAESAGTAWLVARYVESVSDTGVSTVGRLRRVLDLWWLSRYARYLDRNRQENRHLAGRVLPTRDLILHRLWPVAGARAPRILDFLICVLLSAPGFFWASRFLWDRGVLARVPLIVGAVVWSALLVRTSTKPWVRAATPDWSRLRNPKFFLRQMGAALAIGVVVWPVLGPYAAILTFVTAWLAIGLTVGFGQTLATDTRPELVGPPGVLRRERAVSRLSAAVVFPAVAWGFTLTWGPRAGLAWAVVYCLVVGETVACALWRRYLAMIVASAFRLPPAPARLLQRMCSLGLVRAAGISYQFRHDDILQYFAHHYDVREHLRLARHRPAPVDRPPRTG